MNFKKKLVTYFIFICFVCLFFQNTSIAEDQKKADEFFSQGFVVKKKTKIPEKKSNNGFIELGEDPPTPTPTPFLKEESFLKEKKVLYLNALINADDFEHYIKYKEIVEDFCLARKIQLKKFYVICHNCDEVKVSENYNPFHYWILGGDFIILNDVPSIYNQITKSPSYVVGLEKGEIILEGADLLTKYINEKGYYLGELEVKQKNPKLPSNFKLPESLQKMIPKTPTITTTPTLSQTLEINKMQGESWF